MIGLFAQSAADTATVFIISFGLYAFASIGAIFIGARAVSGVLGLFGIQNDPTKGFLDRGKNAINKRGEARKQASQEKKQNAKAFRSREAGIRLAEGKGGRIRTARDRRLAGAPSGGIRPSTRRQRESQLSKTLAEGHQARAEDVLRPVAVQEAEAKVAEAEAKASTYNPQAQQAALASEIDKANVANQSALLSSRTSKMGFKEKMAELETIATDSTNQHEARAAMTMLAQNKGYKELTRVQEKRAEQGPEGAALWRSSLGDNYSDYKELGAGLTVDTINNDGSIKGLHDIKQARLTEMAKLDDKAFAMQNTDALEEILSGPSRIVLETNPITGAVVRDMHVGTRAGAILTNDKIMAEIGTDSDNKLRQISVKP